MAVVEQNSTELSQQPKNAVPANETRPARFRSLAEGIASKFYADLQTTFLLNFHDEQYFQTSVQSLGTATWNVQGLAMLKSDVRL